MPHLLSVADLSTSDIAAVFALSEDLKTKIQVGLREPILPGRMMALIFEKPSLRTRVSFETAMVHLGGGAIFLDGNAGFGKRESVADFGRILSEYVDVVVVRCFEHSKIEEFARHATCSVINGLTDDAHPCQAFADLFTLRELRGDLKGLALAYVGDANNVARSLALACGRLGVEFRIASPRGYQFSEAFRKRLLKEVPSLKITETTDPQQAVRGADAVYTDVWASMGQESEAAERAKIFAPYQVNKKLMQLADKNAVFLHCLPAHRGEEVTDEVIDGHQSRVVPQAGNRLHVQKGIIAWLLGRKG